MEMTSFVLGMLTIIVLAFVASIVLGMVKIFSLAEKVNNLENRVDNDQIDSSRKLEDVLDRMDDEIIRINENFEEQRKNMLSYVDSRLDKLQAKSKGDKN